ncbi:phosphotriesterase-related protein [Epidermidibacterium keratini]|uniref:Phosphotriesterase-related protein n=1 Tax=Epidermidibacterium keratini TaxID=1891644 RepID=A0A7L4YMA7_9ACTN|nr:phosphotriesterase-related protein [Epidermidibacterium keratini]QHC00415.1 phosphotriesterase-related protein [Epidermidibacterium keratini]
MTEVMTVRGPIAAEDLGFTLTHEHVLNDVTSWSHRTGSRGWDPDDLARRPVTRDILWDLKHDPFANLDNCRLDNLELAVAEVERYAALGGQSIIEATGLGIGRDLAGLAEVSTRTGVHIVAGTGYYLESAHPADIAGLSEQELADRILLDVAEGEGGVRPGIIGEIGIGADVTPAEQLSLRAACRAQRETGLPIQIHLPAWFRVAPVVLDIVDEYEVDPAKVVLCHMGPSGDDLAYQEAVLARGVYVQYDMVGMEVFYADQGVQCPSDEQNAAWIARLFERGHGRQVLMSQDIFLKSLLREYGGPGYAHIPQYFIPRLVIAGLSPADITQLTVTNPRELFAR